MVYQHPHPPPPPPPQVNFNNQDESPEPSPTTITNQYAQKHDDDDSSLLVVVKSCNADKHNDKGHLRSCSWTAPDTPLRRRLLVFVVASTISILLVVVVMVIVATIHNNTTHPAIQTALHSPSSVSGWWWWWNIQIDLSQYSDDDATQKISKILLGITTHSRKSTISSSSSTTRNMNDNRSSSTTTTTTLQHSPPPKNNGNALDNTSSSIMMTTRSTVLTDDTMADTYPTGTTILPTTLFSTSSNNKDNNDDDDHIMKNPHKQNNNNSHHHQHHHHDNDKSWKYRNWHYYPTHVIPSHPLDIPGLKENIIMVDVPNIYQLEDHHDHDHDPKEDEDNHHRRTTTKWFMSFVGFDGTGYQSFVAQSYDLLHWTNITLAMSMNPRKGEFDHGGVVLGGYLYTNYHIQHTRTLKQLDGKYWCLYGAYATRGGYEIDPGYQGLASSVDGLVWERARDQPLLSIYDSTVGSWENASIYQPFLLELKRPAPHHDNHYHHHHPQQQQQQQHRQSTTTTTTTSNNHAEENVGKKDDSISSSYFMNIYNAKTLVPQWTEQIGIATSPHLVPSSTKGNTTRYTRSSSNNNRSSSPIMDDHYQWTRYTHNPVLRVRPSNGNEFSYDSRFAAGPKVFRDSNDLMDDHNHNDINGSDNISKWWVNFYVGVDDNWKANIMIAYSQDLYHWDADPLPLYKAGGHPLGLDQDHAHKVSVIWNPQTRIWYMFYCAVGNQGRGIGLLTSKPVV